MENKEKKMMESGVEVTFRRAEATTAEELFNAGWDSDVEQYDADERFEVKPGFEAWYTICAASDDEAYSLGPGVFRFHNGQMESLCGGQWKKYRYDDDSIEDDDFFEAEEPLDDDTPSK